MKRVVPILMLAVATMASASKVRYFPNLAFGERADIHEFVNKWYSKHLRAMKEPSLLNVASDEHLHTYRFLWLRTFHQPIALRLDIGPQSDGILTVKVLNGAGGYKPGKLITRRTIELPPTNVAPFLELLDEIGFWELPGPDPNSGGVDGAQWVLEGVRDGRYHVVDRWTPKGGCYRDTCLMLLQFSELEVDEVY